MLVCKEMCGARQEEDEEERREEARKKQKAQLSEASQ
jgi:hypothetical protein